MVIDTSALVALLLDEPDASRIAEAIELASVRLLSAASFLETSIVIESRKGEAGGNSNYCSIARALKSLQSIRTRQRSRARLGGGTARGDIRPG
jgi:ribonuclease VapC